MLKPAFFRSNRARLIRALPKGALAILNSNDRYPTNGDGVHPFRQNADLFYLTGIEQAESILLLFPTAGDSHERQILFIQDTDADRAVWEGRQLTRDNAREISGIETVRPLSQFDSCFRRLVTECRSVFLNSNEHPRAKLEVEDRDARFAKYWKQEYPLVDFQRLAPLLYKLRQIKTPEEIECMRQAAKITTAGYKRAFSAIRPGVNEREIEAEFAHEFTRSGASFAYAPIIGSGPNTCTLHYEANHRQCQDGELLLLDVGARFHHYHADVTRTVPVNGKFTKRQLAVYEAVLRLCKKATRLCRPGVGIQDVYEEIVEAAARELFTLKLLKKSDLATSTSKAAREKERAVVRKYFMHNIGHSIGLETHDVTVPNAHLARNGVLTIEPGLYIPEENIGVRLENMIQVTDSSPRNLTKAIPLDPGDIEKAVKKKK